MWQMQLQKYLPYSRRCNKYIDETTPWALAKDEAKQDRLADGSLQSGRVHHDRCMPVKELPAGDIREDLSPAECTYSVNYDDLDNIRSL